MEENRIVVQTFNLLDGVQKCRYEDLLNDDGVEIYEKEYKATADALYAVVEYGRLEK